MQTPIERYPSGTSKRRVIDYATQYFFKKGIRNVTMDSISQGLKMSKRTLYQLFADKEQLIIACLEMMMDQTLLLKEKMIAEKHETLEIILKLMEMRLSHFSKMSERYVLDISHYPAVKAFFEEFKNTYIEEGNVFIQKCMAEGTFRQDLNPLIISRAVYISAFSVASSHDFDEFTLNEIVMNTTIITLRGCCTVKGIAIIDRFLDEYYQRKIEPCAC